MSDIPITKLRKLRTRVRGTVNVTGSGQRISEKPGTWWRANLTTRQVEWTPYWPFPPYSRIDDEGIRYCATHESSHTIYSGLYVTKRITAADKPRFHRFVNAIEDVRVDRLSARAFGGFRAAKIHADLILRQAQVQSRPEGWALIDVVAMNAIYAFDIGEPPVGNDFAIKVSTRLWPKLDRIANLASTQQVASALEPIFLKLKKIEKEEAERLERERQAELERRRKEEEERRERIEEQLREQQEEAQREQEAAEDDAGEPEDGEPSDSTWKEDADEDEDDLLGGDGGESSGPNASEDAGSEDEDEAGSGSASSDEGEEQEAADGDEDDPRSGTADDAEQDEGEVESTAEQGAGPGEEADDDEFSPSELDGLDGLDGEAPEDDPLDELDDLPDAGSDEPTDRPVKSDGEPGTEPLAFGEELDGMAQDATDIASQRSLEDMSRQRREEENKARTIRDEQLGKRQRPTQHGVDAYAERQSRMRSKISSLSQRLVTVLRHNAMDNPSTGHRRGRLDTGKAYRAEAGNPRIFRKPGVVGGHDYTFGVLLDVSSSMFTNHQNRSKPPEIWGAFDAVVLVTEALERAGLGIFVILWDDTMRHVKPLAEPLKNHRGSIGTVCGANTGGMTHDDLPISRSLDEFQLVHGRKMLIVITDGESQTIPETTKLLDEIEHEGIKALTIRIGGDPAKHYKHGHRVEHADELVRLLPALINDVVRRGA